MKSGQLSQIQPSEQKAKPTLAESAMAAGTSGFVGAYASFFFEGIKKRLQSNQKIPAVNTLGLNGWLKESFRGSSGFAASLVPTSIIQQMLSYHFKNNPPQSEFLKTTEPLLSGAVGGIASTFAENVILTQQMKKIGPADAISSMYAEGYFRIFRGLPMIMCREGVFGFCYLKAANEASNYATQNYGPAFSWPAKLLVGIAGSLASHPFDTTATTMQRNGYSNILDAVNHLRNENGWRAFYKGGGARVALFTTAMVTISKTQEGVINHFQSKKTCP